MANNRIVQTIYELKDRATATLQRITGGLSRNAAEADKAGRKIDTAAKLPSASFTKLGDAIGRVRGVIIGVTAAVGGLVAGLLKAAKATDEQERAEALLANTLTKVSGARADEIQALKDQAAQLQQTTRFGDEMTISAQAMLGTFALNADQIQQLTPLLQDMAEASRKGADGQADLQSVAIAVGKALTDGIGALTRYGVTLSEAQKEAFRMADQAGKVALVVEVLKANFEGAAEAAGATFGGQMVRARNAVGDFVERIGALVTQSESFQRLADRITNVFATMASTSTEGGSLVQRAVDGIGEALNGALTNLQKGAAFVREYSTALIILAKSFVAVKLGQFVVALGTASAALLANARAALTAAGAYNTAALSGARLRAVMRSFPASIAITIALVGLELAMAGAKKLGEALAKLNVADEVAESQARIREALTATGNAALAQIDALSRFRETQLLNAQQVAALTEQERAAYAAALAGLQDYNRAQFRYLTVQTELGVATDAQTRKLQDVQAQMVATAQAQQTFNQGVKLSADALKNDLTPGAQAFVDKLKDIGAKGSDARKSLQDLFDQTLADGSITALGDLGVAIGKLIDDGGKLGKVLQESLLDILAKLSGDELLKFQSAAAAAFAELEDGAKKSAAVMDGTLIAAMQRLGVEAPKLGVKITDSGRQIIASFQAVAENSRATSQQIEAAFQAALRQANTKEEVDQLGFALEAAAERGAVGMDALERSQSRVRDRLADIRNILNPLTEDFARLGIVSQQELERAAQAAQESFGRIAEAARNGEASTRDVERAFIAAAQAQLRAADGAPEYERKQVEAQIRVQAAANGVTSALEELGLAGKKAGDDVAEGADRAATSLGKTKEAAEEAARAQDQVTRSGGTATQTYHQLSGAAEGAAAAFAELTEEQQAAYAAALATGNEKYFVRQLADEAERLKNDAMPVYQEAIDKYERYLELRQKATEQTRKETEAVTQQAEAVERLNQARDVQNKASAVNADRPIRFELATTGDVRNEITREVEKAIERTIRRQKLKI